MTGQKYITTTVNIIIISSSSAAVVEERGELWESILKQIFLLLSNRSKKEMPFTKLNLPLPPPCGFKTFLNLLGYTNWQSPWESHLDDLQDPSDTHPEMRDLNHTSPPPWNVILEHLSIITSCYSSPPVQDPNWTEQDDDQNDVNSYYNQSVSEACGTRIVKIRHRRESKVRRLWNASGPNTSSSSAVATDLPIEMYIKRSPRPFMPSRRMGAGCSLSCPSIPHAFFHPRGKRERPAVKMKMMMVIILLLLNDVLLPMPACLSQSLIMMLARDEKWTHEKQQRKNWTWSILAKM